MADARICLQVSSKSEYIDIMKNLNLPDPQMMDVAVPGNLKLGISLEKQKFYNGLEAKDFMNQIKDENIFLIDLRENNEIEKDGKINQGIQVPFTKISEYLDKEQQELKQKKIYFYCRVGHRSTLAVQIAKSYNLNNCFHLIGGIKNLVQKNLI